MKRLILTALAAGMLASCNTMTPEQEAAVKVQANRRVTCNQGTDCEVKWGRVLTWVRNNSQYKVNHATESLISTLGPSKNSSFPAYSISKTANGNGTYTIDFDAECDNFWCTPDLTTIRARFNSFVLQ